MITTMARTLRTTANILESVGARRRLRSAPSDVEGAFDFISSFAYGDLRAAPLQVREEMVSLLETLRGLRPRSIVELGTARGGTLFLFTRVAAADACIVTVDLKGAAFGGGYPLAHAPFFRSFARERQTIRLVHGDTHSAETFERVRTAVGGPVDFLFIDADHTYEGVRRDFEMYSPLVRSGGWIAFHDIVEGPPEAVGGVPRFWGELRSRLGEAEEIVADPQQGGYGIGLIQKD